MSSVQKQFVVSVADAFLIDKTTGNMAMKAKALLNSAITQSVQTTPIRGGNGNKLLFEWCYQKDLKATLESAVWSQEYIAINNGETIVTGADNFYVFDEIVTLVAGSGTVLQTPIGDIYVEKEDGSYITVTPTASAFSVSGGANTTVKVTYQYSVSIDKITINADNYAHAYELVLKSKILNQDGTKLADLEIVIPQYKPNGNFDITFGATAASTSKMEGMALVYTDENGLDVYAYVNIKPVSTATSYIDIAATPSAVTISTGSPTKQLVVYGIQGGIKSNVLISSAASGTTYVSGTPATCTISTGGLITRVGSGSSIITISNGALTDTVTVTSS